MSLSPVITSAASLQRLEGVAGVMLFKGQNMIHRQMPFSDMRADNLREIISQMLDGYRQVRRKIHQIYLEFDGGVLLLVLKDEAVMLFFLTSRADADLAASAASVMLNDHAALLHAASTAPQPVSQRPDGIEELVVTSPRALSQITEKAEATVNQWGAVRKCVEGVLGKVMGRAQASNLIERTIEEAKISDPYRLTATDVRKLAISVIEHVPNISKRRQLLVELDAAMEHLKS
ncbi:hypothetical protein [Prosthecobacter sp.]|uniref:hypothetical protein n=1 Tax=Prosthecobacter sp. TaxID=1965333 RepID=UPI001D3A4EF6|nr:hypothetical protein [Prosthecobacter sp.]MCB1279832.1 hypothetical protein [Prosthecobacter sp.]